MTTEPITLKDHVNFGLVDKQQLKLNTMKYYVIKSNSGNHTGFNRKWSLIAECTTLRDAKSELINASLNLDDNHILINGRAYDRDDQEYVCTNSMDSFYYDGCTYAIVPEDEIEHKFNGGHYGYTPEFMTNYDAIEEADINATIDNMYNSN